MPETSPKPTRAEAARLNGGRSRGPTTPEGKARSARNALKHGLTAQTFALLPGEDAQAYAQLLGGLARCYRPADELAAHLVQRLASVMWRQRRADRLEAEVLTQLEQRHDPSYVGGYVPSSPRAWDAARFSAVQRQQARLDRTFLKLMDELDRLTPADDEDRPNEPKVTTPAGAANDDEEKAPNEPDASADAPVIVLPTNDGGGGAEAQNEPERDGSTLAPDAWLIRVERRVLEADAALRAAGLPGLDGADPARPAPAPAPGMTRPHSGDLLPLAPELEALLAAGDGTDPSAWPRFVAGRTRQVDAALKAAGLPGLGPWPAAAPPA